jgi:hypothetical protein
MRLRTTVMPTLALLLAASGCALAGSPACTLKDGRSGVTVGWAPKVFPELKMATYELCAGATCSKTTRDFSELPIARLSVELPDDVGEKQVTVRLSVVRAGEAEPYLERSAETVLKRTYPNGAGCAPTLYFTGFTLDRKEGLRRA